MNEGKDKTRVTVDEAADLIARGCGNMLRQVNGLEDKAEELAAAYDKGGVPGVRAFLERARDELKSAIDARVKAVRADAEKIGLPEPAAVN